MLTFRDFKRGPGRGMCERLGIYIDKCLSWDDFSLAAIRANTGGALGQRARNVHGVASSGECVLLHAILHAADFDRLADELTEGRAWYRMSRVSGAHRDALLACIARQDLL